MIFENRKKKLIKIYFFLFNWILAFHVNYSISFSQLKSTNQSLLLPDSIDLLILGENHFFNNTPHKYEFLKQLYFDFGIKRIGLEYPISIQKLCNDYIASGDEKVYLKIKSTPFSNKQDQMSLLHAIRTLKLENVEIEVFCYDIEAYIGKHSFKGIIQYLEYLNDSNLNYLKFLFQQKVTLKTIDSISSEIKNELLSNQRFYQEALGVEYLDLLNMLKGVEINNMFDEGLRESFLAEIINKQSLAEKTIVFTGNYHANLLFNDTELYSKSMSCFLRDSFDRNIKTYFTVYSNKRRSVVDFFFTDLIDLIDVEKIEKKNYKWMTIEERELEKFPFFSIRCNGVIVVNCYKTRKGKRWVV